MLNTCQFIGRVGKDPEIRTIQSGGKVANLSIACSERWKDKATGEKKEKTTWVPVVIWGNLAEIVEEYVSKGSKIYVSGKFSVRKWQDKDGNDRYATEIVLQGYDAKLILLDGARTSSAGDTEPAGSYDDRAPASAAGRTQQEIDDEIPF